MSTLLLQTKLHMPPVPPHLVHRPRLVVMVAAAASYVPARNATRLTVHEVLAYE